MTTIWPQTIAAPISGTVVPAEQLSDPLFAAEALGYTAAIVPSGRLILSPVAGTIVQIAQTSHGILIDSDEGAQVLVHVGIDTVELKGKPFEVCIEMGQRVEPGVRLMEADFTLIEEAGLDGTVIVAVTNSSDYTRAETAAPGPIEASEPLIRLMS